MSNIIDLNVIKEKHNQSTPKEDCYTLPSKPHTRPNILRRIMNGVISVLRVVLALLWTPINWILALDCFFQLMRAIYYWNDPAVHATWTFLIHFSIYVSLMLFITSEIKRSA